MARSVALPVLFVVDRDPNSLEVLLSDLSRRFGNDFALRGEASPEAALAARLETSMPGVFAAGDVRQGSIKRVASAVGEGATVVRLLHEHLRDYAPARAAN